MTEVPDDTKNHVLKLARHLWMRGRSFQGDEKTYANGDPRRHVVCLDDRRMEFEDGFIDLRSYIMSWEKGLLRYEIVAKDWSATFSGTSDTPEGHNRWEFSFDEINWMVFAGDLDRMFRTFILLKMFDVVKS